MSSVVGMCMTIAPGKGPDKSACSSVDLPCVAERLPLEFLVKHPEIHSDPQLDSPQSNSEYSNRTDRHSMTEDNKAIFLSYASQDADAARRICDALRAAGLECGSTRASCAAATRGTRDPQADQGLRAVHALISANTQARTRVTSAASGLAVERMLDMADDQRSCCRS